MPLVCLALAEYKFTEYFEKEVLRKRPYLKKEWGIRAIEAPFAQSRKKEIDIAFGWRFRSRKGATSGSSL